MRLGRVEDLLRRIETQTVEMKFLGPIRSVAREKLAHRSRLLAVEIERRAPLRVALEVVFTKVLQVIAIGSKVVVDDIEDHGEAVCVRRIDECAEIVGSAVPMVGSE